MSDVSPSNLNEKLRSSMRLPISMPIVLSGRDSDGNAFVEHTETLVVNKGGAKIVTKHSLSKGARLRVSIPHLNREQMLTVVWVSGQKKDKYNTVVGVGLDKPSDFWGVHFPEEHEVAHRKGLNARITQELEIPIPVPAKPARVEPPPAEPPRVEAARAELPPAEPPRIEAARVEPPPAEPPRVEAARVEPPPVEPPPVETPRMETPQVAAPPPPPLPPPPPTAQAVVSPAQASTDVAPPAGFSSRMFGVLQEFVGEALEASIAAVLRQARQKAEEDLARARQAALEQAQQLLRQEVESARARQEQHAAEAGARISALVAEAMQAGIQSAQEALLAERTTSETRFRETAAQDSDAVQEGLRRAGQEIVGRVREQLTHVAKRQSEDFERDLQDALRSRVAGWGAFIGDTEQAAAARVQEALSATVSRTLEQAEHSLSTRVDGAAHRLEERSAELAAGHAGACQESLESAVRAARLRFAALLREFDSGLAEAQSRAAGRFDGTLEEAKRRSSEQAGAALTQLADESAQRHAEVCRQAEETLAKTTSDRLHGHLTHFELRLSEFERRAAASLEHILAGIMDKVEEDCRGKLEQAQKSSVEVVQSRLEGVVAAAVQDLESQARERLSQATHEAVASAQNDAIVQTQVSLRAAVEAALEQLEMRAIGVVHHNEEACNQALTALADAHEARLSAHLAECQVKLSSSARKILQELARSLASLNFGVEKPIE